MFEIEGGLGWMVAVILKATWRIRARVDVPVLRTYMEHLFANTTPTSRSGYFLPAPRA